MRQETRVSRSTRLLVVTEGVFTRMITDEQSLSGVSCVLFDEFHERSIASDTGLALALESQSILRPDLHLGILSVTLDRESLKKILPDAPEVDSPAPGYPVRTVYAPDRTPGLFSLTGQAQTPAPAHGRRDSALPQGNQFERSGLSAGIRGNTPHSGSP